MEFSEALARTNTRPRSYEVIQHVRE